MSTINDIHNWRRKGDSIAEIARKAGVCRDTVYKYLGQEDFTPAMPLRAKKRSKLDPYRPLIEQWLDEDAQNWRKQRHSAHRIWERLTVEEGLEVSEARVRDYVRELKRERREALEQQFLDLEWAPGIAQADFGEADFYVRGVRTRMSFLVLSFPYSNVGIAQVFPGENAECVCQGLKDIFEFTGGVPARIVFDNATGVGRRVCETVRTTETFAAFAAHYGFDFVFCNPNAGHEKGNVERKVDYIRSNLFVPLPRMMSVDAFNARLLGKCMELSGKDHWRKGEPEAQLFVEDRFAMPGLPEKAFRVVRWVRAKANKQGKFCLEGRHFYSSDPSLASAELVIGVEATKVLVYDSAGTLVCEHARAYGTAPTDTVSPASQLPLLCVKAGGWHESRVRAAMPDELREHMDSLDKPALREKLRLMRDQNAVHGWDATLEAMQTALAATGRIDEASVGVAAARILSGAVSYDEAVDLGAYDRALGLGR